MEAFEPGDRVVAVDTDMSRMIRSVRGRTPSDHGLPDGPPQKGVVYHVRAVKWSSGGQGLFITGLRGLYDNREVPWGGVRFRKLDSLKGHAPKK